MKSMMRIIMGIFDDVETPSTEAGAQKMTVASGRYEGIVPGEGATGGRRETVTGNGTTSRRKGAAQVPAAGVGLTFKVNGRSQELCAPGEVGPIGSVDLFGEWAALGNNAFDTIKIPLPRFKGDENVFATW